MTLTCLFAIFNWNTTAPTALRHRRLAGLSECKCKDSSSIEGTAIANLSSSGI